MESFAGHVALITGAAGGFGQSLIRQLLPLGARLLLADIDREALAARTRETLKSASMEQHAEQLLGYFAADLATPNGPDALMAAIAPVASQLDILINNAGIAQSGHFSDIPQDAWERLMQVNLLAPMRLTALALPGMLNRRHGHIANISSVAGLIGVPTLAPYSTAKFGLRGFSEALAADVRPSGVYVTVIFPFFTRTPILDSPHYGPPLSSTLPDWLISDPDAVMRALVRGMRRHRLHVYPGALPHALNLWERLTP